MKLVADFRLGNTVKYSMYVSGPGAASVMIVNSAELFYVVRLFVLVSGIVFTLINGGAQMVPIRPSFVKQLGAKKI